MNNDPTLPADAEQDLKSENVDLARMQLELARRILELTREQEKAVAVLPDEEAIGRFLALVDARQECMARFDLLQQARAPAAGAGEPVSALQAEIQALFREAARIDAVNLEALRAQRELIREEIRKVQKGREAVRSYGHQGAGRPEDGAFVDKKK